MVLAGTIRFLIEFVRVNVRVLGIFIVAHAASLINNGDNPIPRKSRRRIYLAFSRGEVAERLKAAVC